MIFAILQQSCNGARYCNKVATEQEHERAYMSSWARKKMTLELLVRVREGKGRYGTLDKTVNLL